MLALVAAVLFAVHPAYSEAVTWISGTTDATCGFFFVLSMLAYLRFREHGHGLDLALLHLSFLAGMFSKETMAAFVPLLLAYDRIVLRRWPRPADVARVYAPLLATVALYLGMRVAAIGSFAAPGLLRHTSLSVFERLLNQLVLLGGYVLKFLDPRALNAFHVFEPVHALGDTRTLGALALLTVSGAVVVWAGKAVTAAHRDLAWVGLFWFVLTLAPVLVFFRRLGENVFAERYLYVPSMGLCLTVAALVVSRVGRRTTPLLAGLAVVAVLGAGRVYARNLDWRDEVVFYETTLRSSPNARLLWMPLGDAYADKGRFEDAVRAYQNGVALRPDYQIYCNLGIAYSELGRIDEAIAAYQASLERRPNETAYSNLGIAYHLAGRYDDAVRAQEAAISLQATARAYYNLATTYYLGLRRYPEAVAAYEAALRLEPHHREAAEALGAVRQDMKDAALRTGSTGASASDTTRKR